MAEQRGNRVATLLSSSGQQLLEEWLREQLTSSSMRSDLVSEGELRQQAGEFLRLLQAAAQQDTSLEQMQGPAWEPVRDFLSGLSRARAMQGFSPSETAMFVLSLKQPLFAHLRNDGAATSDELGDDLWRATSVLDRLGLYTTEAYQKSREAVIARQQQELIELSTPVVKLWDGILAVPLIGTLDSARTQVVMESLLTRIVETGAGIAIIDITGVPTVDTLVAQHLIKTVQAARLMGAECIISGIRPQIAQTIVHLGVVLENVVTKASLADAVALAFQRVGVTVSRATFRG